MDIYDLDNKRDQGTQGPINVGFFKEMKDAGMTTDFNRKLLVSQDWFYSQLYRDMLRVVYKKQGKPVPDYILKRFARHDLKGNFKDFDGPLIGNHMDMTT